MKTDDVIDYSLNLQQSGHYLCDQSGTLICLPGWSDEKRGCTVPHCDFDGLTCDHGNCTHPQTCTCEVGW